MAASESKKFVDPKGDSIREWIDIFSTVSDPISVCTSSNEVDKKNLARHIVMTLRMKVERFLLNEISGMEPIDKVDLKNHFAECGLSEKKLQCAQLFLYIIRARDVDYLDHAEEMVKKMKDDDENVISIFREHFLTLEEVSKDYIKKKVTLNDNWEKYPLLTEIVTSRSAN